MSPPSDAPLPNFPRFETQPYGADGGFTLAGSTFMVTAAVVSGLVLGFLASLISQWFYLVLLFPAAIGLGMGAVFGFAIRFGKVRSPALAGVAGFLGGCMAMFTMHYCDYQRFLGEVNNKLPGLQINISFVTFMDLQATEGVTIGRAAAGNKDKGMNLGYAGSIIYWLVEAMIVAGITFAMAKSAAGEPFCAQCQEWKVPRALGQLSMSSQSASQALTTGNLEAFHQRLQMQAGEAPTCVLHAAICPACGVNGAIDVKVSEATQNDKGETQLKELAHMTYPGEALAVFEAVFAAPPTPGPDMPAT